MWKKCKNLVFGKSVAVDFLWLVSILFHKIKIATVGKKKPFTNLLVHLQVHLQSLQIKIKHLVAIQPNHS